MGNEWINAKNTDMVDFNKNRYQWVSAGDIKVDIEWQQISLPNCTTTGYSGVAYGKGTVSSDPRFVVIGLNTIGNSSDGITWTRWSSDSRNWRDITYNEDASVFTVINSDMTPRCTRSQDMGIHWTESILPSVTSAWSLVAHDLNTVAIAYNTDIFASSLNYGATWTQGTLPLSLKWMDLIAVNKRFIASARDTDQFIYSTANAKTVEWEVGTMPSSRIWTGMVYGNDKVVMLSYGDVAAYSVDGGINWTETKMPSTKNWRHAVYADGVFIAVSYNDNGIAYSVNGIDWKELPYPEDIVLPKTPAWTGMAYGDKKIVLVSSGDMQRGLCGTVTITKT